MAIMPPYKKPIRSARTAFIGLVSLCVFGCSEGKLQSEQAVTATDSSARVSYCNFRIGFSGETFEVSDLGRKVAVAAKIEADKSEHPAYYLFPRWKAEDKNDAPRLMLSSLVTFMQSIGVEHSSVHYVPIPGDVDHNSRSVNINICSPSDMQPSGAPINGTPKENFAAKYVIGEQQLVIPLKYLNPVLEHDPPLLDIHASFLQFELEWPGLLDRASWHTDQCTGPVIASCYGRIYVQFRDRKISRFGQPDIATLKTEIRLNNVLGRLYEAGIGLHSNRHTVLINSNEYSNWCEWPRSIEYHSILRHIKNAEPVAGGRCIMTIVRGSLVVYLKYDSGLYMSYSQIHDSVANLIDGFLRTQ